MIKILYKQHFNHVIQINEKGFHCEKVKIQLNNRHLPTILTDYLEAQSQIKHVW